MADFQHPAMPAKSNVRAESTSWVDANLTQGSLYRRIFKRALDVTLAATLLVMASPILALIAGLVALDGSSPLYAQARVGLHGARFECLKFRSMVPDAARRLEELLRSDPAAAREWRETQKLVRDPRITRIGRLLRMTSLDELPQLWNVLRGDMSIVGPRPVTEDELDRYGAVATQVLSTRPGMTGLWQVTGRGQGVSYPDRVQMDVRYVRSMTFWTDTIIVFRTAVVVFRGTGT